MQLNTHARMACPEYSGPYLEPSSIHTTDAGQGMIEKSVTNTLEVAVGGDKFLKTNVWTNLGYRIGKDGIRLTFSRYSRTNLTVCLHKNDMFH